MKIYKITNIKNNKVYIGQCTGSVQTRFARHFNDAKNGLNTHFSRALRKYSKEDFILEVIDSADNRDELNKKEQYWIKYYDSCLNGYNSTSGGDGGNTYIKKTEEELKEISEKIRATKIGGLNPHAISIKAININTKEELFFNSLSEACSYFNLSNHNIISQRIRGLTTSAYNEEWCFAYADAQYYWNTKKKGNHRRLNVEVINPNTFEVIVIPNYTKTIQFLQENNITGE